MTDEISQPRMILYGRRRGRPLRRHRSDLLETLLPALRLEIPADGGRIEPARLFQHPVSDLWLEVGFGGGEHLAAQAAANPGVGLIGCEPFVNGVASLLQHVEARGLENVRIVPDDARPVLDALPDASVGRVFVLFPDPWPKLRHAFRRFIGPDNLPRLARVLKDGAELRLATDDWQLCRWMLEHTWRHPDFEWLARRPEDWRVRPDDWPQTRYEQKAVEAGRKPVFLRFRRRPR
ncbi:tRNA (guanine(46)-N(7))-methyltransferase TrmB [Rhodospirillum centenum]|uniref:tRNA (guanine-N(7)-)-methyltransferase n=1 Tax=Rhodospirillum centenum (strain ATCC 51521 / SW) TaxID=414684 RepID=B6IVL5_RHOCS|nr:tRNA (guanine(46)-N(7))-methyltransferase TrmB [Rhodospirillum centenum]ACJ00339.1 tRNA (guanine-N(7)-)-methyltransferase [Rhodospirillum centenum SW]